MLAVKCKDCNQYPVKSEYAKKSNYRKISRGKHENLIEKNRNELINDLGYKTFDQGTLSFKDIKDIIIDNNIDLMVTHAYMKIIPEDLFLLPQKKSINIHASLLPKYRGACPAKWVLENKEKQTGLTCHYIDKGIDTGDIICQVTVEVKKNDKVEDIIERSKAKVPHLINDSLNKINDKAFKSIKQCP